MTKALALIESYNELEKRIQDAFDKCQAAGLIQNEREENGKYVSQVEYGFRLERFEISSKTIEIYCYKSGSGWEDNELLSIPFEALDNVDGHIAHEKQRIADSLQEKNKAAAKEQEAARIRAERKEKEFYEHLKEKYEGRKT